MTADVAVAKKMSRAERLAQIKLEKKKRLKKRLLIAGAVLAFFGILIFYGFQPLRGPVQFGVCRSFLELQLKYPQTLDMIHVEIFDKSLRMYYMYTDSFGSKRSEMMECDFRPFSLLNLETVKRNRVLVNPQLVENFNVSIPAIMSVNPDLTIPAPPRGDLRSLKKD